MIQGKIDEAFLPILGKMKLTHSETGDQEISSLIGEVVGRSVLSGLTNTIIDYRFPVIFVLKINQ